MLDVRGLTKAYGDLTVLRDVSFAVRPGEAAAVVGPNGAGKSTLLHCVVGSAEADSGSVRLDGVEVRESDPAVRAAVAAVLDDVDFFPDLSVVEHLDLLAHAHGGGGVDEVLVELGLDGVVDQVPSTLSSGQRRRLALASCLVRPRRLLVLDEPEQRLDAAGRAWLAERLTAEKASGTAVLLATHDVELRHAVADRHVDLGA
ncbi:ABC transporter ATP-binding protein [Umezawaea sp.]|uniref:ABC transporter ATP-binding protein n=1 Tax=Umezawaea sp. TaxID=1955258 RepID=UPI002ED04650